jgi:hypothetical protein
MPEPLRLIALTGRAGAGKDSVAATLVRHRNYRTIAFADALRAEIAAAWRIDPRMLQDPATKEWDIPALAVGMCGDTQFIARHRADGLDEPRSPRWVMQRWGDHQKARLGARHYADIVIDWLLRQYGTGWTRLLVTDLRFAVEHHRLRLVSDRLRVVRVHRPGLPATPATHASEREQVFITNDVDLVNDGTLEDLVFEAQRMEACLFGGMAP